ncbi:MAG TPA: sulfatase-like hydrolase/transferase [Chthoniobacterales bacterium]|nr:sulfatase-like hydrolase/transferase [Chthoniobacterales bacterium]
MSAKPNILFIMCDQLRADALGCTGNWVRTPNIDRIAREGILFSNCVTNSPVCLPARVSLAVGRYPHETGVWDNCPYELPQSTPTWMGAIQEAGYRTSLFGKFALHRRGPDIRKFEDVVRSYGLDDVNEIRGPRANAETLSHLTARWEALGLFEAFKNDIKERKGKNKTLVRPSPLPLSEYYDVYVGQQAKNYLQSYERPEPWFCWVSFAGPHEPWDTPEPYAHMYHADQMPAPLPRPAPRRHGPKGELDARFAEATDKIENARELRANYAGKVTLIDDQVGEILKAVEQRGELDRTVVLFTSDHGEMNGDYDLIHKSNFLNPAVRIPLIIRTTETQGSSAGRILDQPVELLDAGATLTDLAGGEIKYRSFARSLAPLLVDSKSDHRDFALSELKQEMMYLDREWKLMLNAKGEPYRLFDLKNDPNEVEDVVDRSEHKDLVAELKRQLFQRRAETSKK